MATAQWISKLLMKLLFGLIWLVIPSVIMLTVGLLVGPHVGWPAPLVYMAAVNAIILWPSMQLTCLVFERHMRRTVKNAIEAYHDEFVALRYWVNNGTGGITDLETLKSLKNKLEIE